jgi:membrane glycosyltransferase
MQVVGYGVVGTVSFVYMRVRALAVGTRDKVATAVLEVADDTTDTELLQQQQQQQQQQQSLLRISDPVPRSPLLTVRQHV